MESANDETEEVASHAKEQLLSDDSQEAVAASGPVEEVENQRRSRKRKRNTKGVDGPSRFLNIEAQVSHDEEDDHPTTHYSESSSSRYLPQRHSSGSRDYSSFNDNNDSEASRHRPKCLVSQYRAFSDSFSPIQQSSTDDISDEGIRSVMELLLAHTNPRCRRTWSEDAHTSHRWLYELQGDAEKFRFWVKLFGQDDGYGYPFKGQEMLVTLGFTELGDRCIFYQHEKQDRILPNQIRIEPRGITLRTKKALYVLRGDHAGKCVVRLATVPVMRGTSEAMYACCPVDVEAGEINRDLQYAINAVDACQIEVEKSVFTRMYKQARDFKESNGARKRRKGQL